jgi:hypothetical protein
LTQTPPSVYCGRLVCVLKEWRTERAEASMAASSSAGPGRRARAGQRRPAKDGERRSGLRTRYNAWLTPEAKAFLEAESVRLGVSINVVIEDLVRGEMGRKAGDGEAGSVAAIVALIEAEVARRLREISGV